jgi:hypothetical protein
MGVLYGHKALYNPKPPKCALTCLGELAADRMADADEDEASIMAIALCSLSLPRTSVWRLKSQKSTAT